jgi:uncharacterized protein YabE (DUF348 family)
MGNILMTESHTTRSSGKLSVSRWNHPMMRLLVIAVVTVALLSALFTFLWQGSSIKQVTLVVNGEAEQFETDVNSVGELLASRGVEIQEYDKVSESLDASLHNGVTVSVQHAVPVVVQADGELIQHFTTVTTVEEALTELALTLGEEDKIQPALHKKITANELIQVVRVGTVIEEVQEAIPFDTITKEDTSLLKGKSTTVQEGQEGVLVKKYKKVLEDGIVVSTTLVDETVATPSKNQVVALGTRNPVMVLSATSPTVESVTKSGVTFGAKQVLQNVKLTAYDAGPASTGKTEEHPWYGMTYTGTKVKEGRTIAVDPKVIPLGWWVYIEGIGFRRAEDIGSAIKGKKIDIYFESEAHALKFGTKSGYTVYVIGPKKPDVQ